MRKTFKLLLTLFALLTCTGYVRAVGLAPSGSGGSFYNLLNGHEAGAANHPLLGPNATSFSPTSAGPGVTLTIAGENFTTNNVVSVTVGGKTASITSVADAQIKVKVPCDAASGHIVIDYNGVWATDDLSGFTFVAITKPTITVTSGSATVCSGNAVTLSSNAASGWLWSNGETTKTITTENSGSYTVQTISNGCTSAVSNATTVTILATPVRPVIRALSGTALCPGNTAYLQVPDEYYEVEDFAGQAGASAWVDDNGTDARFSFPRGIAIDASGNIFIADYYNNRIRKLAPNGDVSTFAGSGTAGSANGTGTAASFNHPSDVAIDNAGNLYVADIDNYLIRKITSAGVVSTYAGNGDRGTVNSTRLNSAFTDMAAIATDKSGNVYLSQGGANNVVRKITSTNVTTFIGSTQGHADGTGTAAKTGNIMDIAVDTAGNLYLADFNSYIRKVTPAGVVSTIAGTGNGSIIDGPVASATLSGSNGIAVSASGSEIYFSNGIYIRKISNGYITTLVKSDGNTVAFGVPENMVFDAAGNLFTCNPGSNIIRKATFTSLANSSVLWSDGNTSRIRPVSDNATLSARLVMASCTSDISAVATVTMGTPPSAATITVSGSLAICTGSNVVLTSSASTGIKWSGSSTSTNQSITVSSAGTYTINTISGTCTTVGESVTVTTVSTPAVPTFSVSGTINICEGSTYSLSAVSAASTGFIWNNGATGKTLNITESGVYSVKLFSGSCTSAYSNSVTINVIPKPATPAISAPIGLTSCSGAHVILTSSAVHGNRWSNGDTTQSSVVTTAGSYTVYVISGGCSSATSAASVVVAGTIPLQAGITSATTASCDGSPITLTAMSGPVVSTFAGNGTNGFANGTGAAASFNQPYGMAKDASGNIYVADYSNHLIRKVTPQGVVSTFAGTGTGGHDDGTLTTATFFYPRDLTFDPFGNLFVAEFGNRSIRKITPAGNVTTFVGNPLLAPGNTDGTGSAALLNGPYDIESDASGNLYLLDMISARIRKITQAAVVTTFAGSTQGTADGTGTNAQFGVCYGMTIDALGNLYVAEISTGLIRKVTPAAVVTTFAGSSSTRGYIDGTGASAGFGSPSSVAADASGNLYVTDNSYIRKITSAGVVSTLPAGNGTFGYADGVGSNARLSNPFGIIVDASGNLIISESPTGKLRKIVQVSVTPTAYLWSNGETTSTISAAISGSYTVQSIYGSCTAAASDAKVITIGTQPAIPTISAPGGTTYCSGTVTLTSSLADAYYWSNGSNAQSIQVTAGSYYVYIVTNGCVSPGNSATTVVTNTAPSSPSVTQGSAVEVCSGATTTLTATSAAGYYWSTGETTQSIAVGAGSYTVKSVTGACTSAASSATVVTSTVLNAPAVTPAGPVSVCSGETTTLTASAAAGYLWSNNATTQSITVGAGSYTVKLVSGSCTSAAGTATVVTVGTGTPPSVSVLNNESTTICPGSTITLVAGGGSAAKAPTQYLWSNNATTPTIAVTAAGTYSVRFINNARTCTSGVSNVITVTNAAPNTPTISASDNTTLCSGQSVRLSSSSASGNLWSNNATSQTITVAASQAGSYTVRVISGTCTSQSSLPTVVTDASNPVISGGITGSTAVQPGSTHTYSVSPVTGATSYSWEFEGSGTITGSGATVSITFGTQSGTLIVQAETPCGTSEPAYIDVDIASASVTDLAISSNQSISGTYNNVTITGSPTVTLSGDLTVQGNITVPDGATFNTNCHNVTGSGTFTLQAGGTLKVCNTAGISASGSTGAVQTAGRSFSNDANYEYLGIAAQLTGSGLPGKVRNLTVNNEYNVSLSNPVSVSRVLDLKLGFLFTNDQLTLLSDAGGTAMVINNVGRTIGTAKVQRYITATVNSGTGYRHYSSPVVNQSLSGLTSTSGNFTPMLNTDYNTAARPGSVTPFPNVFTFDESRISTQHDTFSLGWKVPTGIMETCRGYSVNIGANQTLQVSGDLVNAETSVDFTGGSANNSGWLLAGNPYPSPIDWNLVQADLGGQFENAIYTAQSTGQYAGRYGSYVNGVANNGGSRYLASMQGFFMRANLNNSGTLFFQNTHRVTTYMNPSFYRTESRADLIRLQLSAAGSADDETVIYFENDAFGGFDKDKDAGKVHAGGMSLYSLNGSEHFSINCLPSEMLNSSNTRVRLAYASVAEGIHTLSALESDANWFIFDHTDSRLHAMPYSFSTAKGRFENRLELVRINTVSGISTAGPQLSLHPNPSNGSLQLSLPGQSQINIYDAAGRLMQSSEMNNMRTLDISAFPAGVYMLHCTGAGNSSVHKVVKQ